MFDRYILASKFERVAKRFDMARMEKDLLYQPSYNIAVGDNAYVLTDNIIRIIHSFRFGITGLGRNFPDTTCFIRSEGKRNKTDDPDYSGSMAVFLQPEFKSIIRTQRCLVFADAFVVGIEQGKPHLVYMENKQRPFSMAGIWKEEDGIKSFAILTVPANSLLLKLGMKRMPVILHRQHENRWIRSATHLSNILELLKVYPSQLMNAYPVSMQIADKSVNDVSLVQPVGKPVVKAASYYVPRRKIREERNNDNMPSWGEQVGNGKEDQ